MAQRIAAAMSLLAFAICLIIGGMEADNPFTTTVSRALIAMVGTLIVGLIVGAMAQKMLDENLKDESKKLKNLGTKSNGSDR